MQSKKTKLKYVSQLILGGTPSTDDKKNWIGGNIPWIDSGKVNLREIFLKDVNKFITNEATKKSSTQLVRCASPLLAITGATCSKVAFLHFDCYINQSIIGFDTRDNINPRYIFYVLISLKDEIISLKSGGAQGGVTKKDIENLSFNYVNIEYQNLISKYLDNQSQMVDSLIEKIEKKIELLKEQKIALINQYVTKGLKLNQEMKDTGVDWIGEIPKSWELKKLKYFSEIIYGISPSEKTYNDKGIGTLLINGPVEYSKEDFGLTRSVKWTTEPTKIVQKGTLLFCLRGSTTGRMNITHEEVSIGRGVCAIQSKFDQDFLVFAMMMVRIYIQDQISGSTFPSVTKDDVDNFIIPLPDYEEQKNISSKLKSKTKIFEQYIKLNNNKIKLLKEYKESLITSTVNGNIRITEDML